MITKTFFKQKWGLLTLSLFLGAGCSPSTVTYKTPKKAVPTAGERIHEALLLAQENQVCEKEKTALIHLKKNEIVSSIDLLLHDFLISLPDEQLFRRRVHWVLNTPIELGFEYLAGVLHQAKDPLNENIEILFPHAQITLPTSDELWKAVSFAKKPELKVLEARLRLGLSEETLQVLHRIREISESDRARFVFETLMSSKDFWMPKEERALFFYELAQREDVRFLAKSSVNGLLELLEPGHRTQDLLNTINSVKSRLRIKLESQSASKEKSLQLFRVLQSDELDLLLEGLSYKGLLLDLDELVERLHPFYVFFKNPESQDFVQYLKRFLTEPKNRHFIFDFTDFAQRQRGFFEEYFLSLCLGESWTSLMPGRKLCVQRMKWAGLDGDLSRELLDQGALLYQNGLIEKALELELFFRDLQYKYRDEIGLLKMLAQRIESSVQVLDGFDLKSYLENEESRGQAIYYFEELFEGRLDEAIIHLFDLGEGLYKAHTQEVEAIKGLISDKIISLKNIDEQEVEAIFDFFNDKQNQNAFSALVDLTTNDGLGIELKHLYQIVSNIPQTEPETLEALRILARDLGLSLSIPSRKTIKKVYAFLNDAEKIEASKTLARTIAMTALGFREFQSFFESFPGEPIDYWSLDTRNRIFSAIDNVSESDTAAISSLIRISFDIWALSENESCQLAGSRSLKPQNIGSELKRLGRFLVDEKHGLGSLISLVRRIAKDTPL